MGDDRWGDETADLLRETTDYAVQFLRGLPDRPVRAKATHAELTAALGGELPSDGEPAQATLARLRASDDGVIAIPGPRYFGFVIGGSLPAALAADWLTSTWDQNAGAYAPGPSASVAEEVAGGWLVDLFGLPESSSFGFTTGCQMAHVTCLAAARHAVLDTAGWDVERRGLIGAPPVRIIVGGEAHATIFAALQYLGQVLVRFGDDDQVTRDVVAAVQRDGTCWLSGSTWQGRGVMRISVSNWSTTTADVDASAAAILRCFASVRAGQSRLDGSG